MSVRLNARCSLFARRLSNERKAAGVHYSRLRPPTGFADAKSHFVAIFFPTNIHPRARAFTRTHGGTEGSREAGSGGANIVA